MFIDRVSFSVVYVFTCLRVYLIYNVQLSLISCVRKMKVHKEHA